MLNQILEQAEREFDTKYKKARTRLSFLASGARDEIKQFYSSQLTTAFTAGVKKGVEEEKERVRNKYDLIRIRGGVCGLNHDEKIYNLALSDLLSELNKQEK
jgi:hypothetical protein